MPLGTVNLAGSPSRHDLRPKTAGALARNVAAHLVLADLFAAVDQIERNALRVDKRSLREWPARRGKGLWSTSTALL